MDGSLFINYRSLVHVRLSGGEVLHLFEGVDRDEDWADVGEDPVVHEALPEVFHDGRLLDVAQQHHVVHPGPLVVRRLPGVSLGK